MKTDTNNDKPKVVFIPYELELENIKTIGNYKSKDSLGEIETLNRPTYDVTVNEEDVTEFNVDPPSNKMSWNEFVFIESNKGGKNE